MRNLLRIEIRKAIKNKWFFIAVGIGLILAVASAAGNALTEFQSQSSGLQFIDQKNMQLAPLSLYKFWIVTDFIQPTTDLYFLLLPFLAALPYAWSLASELKSGSIRNALTRTTHLRCLAAKYAAAFLAGGLAITIPIVVNFLICACIMPDYLPDIYSVLYLGIADTNMFSQIYYTMPLLYVLLYTLVNFAFGGLWAALVMSLGAFVANRVALLAGPYLVLVFLKFLEERLFEMTGPTGAPHFGLTPFTYLRGTGSQFYPNGSVVAVEFALFLLTAAVLLEIARRRDIV